MPHFLIKKQDIKDNFIELFDDKDLLHHLIKVLRVKEKEIIKFIDENQIVYLSQVLEIKKNGLCAKIISKNKTDRILEYNICLIQSILSPDAQNLAIANASQTGVKMIYPVISDNTSVSKNSIIGKQEKWQKIAFENFKQCERGDIALVQEIKPLKEILNLFKKENVLILAEKYQNKELNDCLKDIDRKDKIAIVVGPEGGFSEEEFKYFINNNYKLISLGKMIYKAPNAIVAGVSNIISRI